MTMTALAWLGVASGAAAGAVAAMFLVGCFLPRQHVVARTLLLPVPAATVWATLVDFPGQPAWRPGLVAVDRLPDSGGVETWRERSGRHAVTFRVVEATPPGHLVRQVAADDGPFAGRWEFEIEPVVSPASSRVTLIERGAIGNPLLRFANRFVLGQATGVESYLNDLARRFGGEPRFIPSLDSQRETDAPPA